MREVSVRFASLKIKIVVLLGFCFLLFPGFLAPKSSSKHIDQTNPDAILGTWLNAEKDAHILIFKESETYFGKLIWGKNLLEADGRTSKKDVNNPESALQKRNLKDLIILRNMKFEEGDWSGGTIYDPTSGDTYSCEAKLKNDKLELRGYVGFSLFGRTTVWTRVE